MAEFPSLPLFTDAIQADCNHLSDREFGVYLRLLILAWRTPGCSIPVDASWISKRMNCDPLQFHDKIEPLLAEFFSIENGRYFQKRLRREHEFVRDKVQKRRNAAYRRWDIEKQGKMDMQSICNADAPTPTPTPTESFFNTRAIEQEKKSFSEQVREAIHDRKNDD